jgi:hypothetical protein
LYPSKGYHQKGDQAHCERKILSKSRASLGFSAKKTKGSELAFAAPVLLPGMLASY